MQFFSYTFYKTFKRKSKNFVESKIFVTPNKNNNRVWAMPISTCWMVNKCSHAFYFTRASYLFITICIVYMRKEKKNISFRCNILIYVYKLFLPEVETDVKRPKIYLHIYVVYVTVSCRTCWNQFNFCSCCSLLFET